MPNDSADTQRDWIETTALVAPGLLGAAAGMLLGDLMHRNARRGVAIALGGLGIAALVPLLVGGIANKVNGPETARGARRRLAGIRDAGADYPDVDEELREQGIL
ncbi:hypothetical protein [Luteolibacter sp. LG18]|uniref:hypothetical protein n=1 Tax=Luteolibacter sp. LG18 TaxID=2819286 RepID=UPI002B2DE6E2|nr:hypothetical protein llg_06750 [Luteolibacter sp. LG18]